jgi:uridylate kinase
MTSDHRQPPGNAASRPWRRIVLKLSGEALASPNGTGLDIDLMAQMATEIIDVRTNLDVDIAVVVGGGNFWRGLSAAEGSGMDRAQADYIGMIATVMNGLALQDALERAGQPARVQTAIEMPKIAEAYIRRRAVRHMEKGRVVIFAGGTGNPFFTTDTTAALRAAEIDADAILKGTHSGVDGVYTADPKKDSGAERYARISYIDVINRGLKVMDSTAITFCMDNRIPIVVFDLLGKGNIRAILEGRPVGTFVGSDVVTELCANGKVPQPAPR